MRTELLYKGAVLDGDRHSAILLGVPESQLERTPAKTGYSVVTGLDNRDCECDPDDYCECDCDSVEPVELARFVCLNDAEVWASRLSTEYVIVNRSQPERIVLTSDLQITTFVQLYTTNVMRDNRHSVLDWNALLASQLRDFGVETAVVM